MLSNTISSYLCFKSLSDEEKELVISIQELVENKTCKVLLESLTSLDEKLSVYPSDIILLINNGEYDAAKYYLSTKNYKSLHIPRFIREAATTKLAESSEQPQIDSLRPIANDKDISLLFSSSTETLLLGTVSPLVFSTEYGRTDDIPVVKQSNTATKSKRK